MFFSIQYINRSIGEIYVLKVSFEILSKICILLNCNKRISIIWIFKKWLKNLSSSFNISSLKDLNYIINKVLKFIITVIYMLLKIKETPANLFLMLTDLLIIQIRKTALFTIKNAPKLLS